METLGMLERPNMWTLLVEDFHAKTSVLAEKVKELKEKDPVCGRRCIVLYGKLDLKTSSLKTAQLSLFEDLKSCYATLPKQGIMLNGTVYLTRNLDIPTREKESILLPTPIKSDNKRCGIKDPQKLKVFLSRRQKNVVWIFCLKGFMRCQILQLLELMMGFPIGVTELDQ